MRTDGLRRCLQKEAEEGSYEVFLSYPDTDVEQLFDSRDSFQEARRRAIHAGTLNRGCTARVMRNGKELYSFRIPSSDEFTPPYSICYATEYGEERCKETDDKEAAVTAAKNIANKIGVYWSWVKDSRNKIVWQSQHDPIYRTKPREPKAPFRLTWIAGRTVHQAKPVQTLEEAKQQVERASKLNTVTEAWVEDADGKRVGS